MIDDTEIVVPQRGNGPSKNTRTTVRDRIATRLGVSEKRKGEIYLDLARSTTLTDPAYWLQTLFAAGIATLGLALNSPAVIIGAMLISPLMGPILSSGLALAAGDVVLGVRAGLNLALSCLVAVGFAFSLVIILPFKEITNEIAVRMHPTTLDLAVALFSGAIGSIAICKEVKGVVTSIPGVAIAVALMPPLGVVGYGLALAVGLGGAEGMQVALGGGLLFLTNLVAITFTAMIVFLGLHIDTPVVRQQVDQWHKGDPQSVRLQKMSSHLPLVARIRGIGTLPARILMIVIIIVVILIPLGRSFNQLKQELSQQKKENRIRQLVSRTWQSEFGTMANGETRSFLDQVGVTEHDGKLTLLIRVLTTKPLSSSEKDRFNRSLANNLSLSPDALITQVIEVPTAAAALKARSIDVQPQLPPSVNELQMAFMERVTSALLRVNLPPPSQFVDYQLVASEPKNLQVIISYLSSRDIEPDAQELIHQNVKTQLDYPEATVTLERIPVALGQLTFRAPETTLDRNTQSSLDGAAAQLNRHPRLVLEIVDPPTTEQPDIVTEQRLALVKDYLASRWQVPLDRIVVRAASRQEDLWTINLRPKE